MHYQTLASAPLTAIATATAFRSTITMNEAGVLHLADGMLTGTNSGPAATVPVDLSNSIEITALEVNGSIILLKGRNTPSVGSIFSPHRAGNLVALPTIRVESGDTIAISGAFIVAGMAAGDGIWSVPFSPRRFDNKPQPSFSRGAEAIVGSPATAVANNTATALTVTIENHGFIDLNRAWIRYGLVPTANVDVVEGQNAVMYAGLTALTVRNDYPMVVGQGVALASAAFLNPDRSRNFVHLGVHEVSPGDTVVATITADTSAAGDASFGFPQWLSDGSLSQGACAC